jgi:hypothetical protein
VVAAEPDCELQTLTDRLPRTKYAPTKTITPITVTGIVHARRLESADWHSATKSVCGITWLRTGMFATDLLFAS